MSKLDKLKDRIRREASDNPDKFFATDVIKQKGFSRDKCKKCGKYFWSKVERDYCGDPECCGGYSFIGNTPTSDQYGYVEVWKKFKEFMEKRSYKSINRYPVIARWRDDVEFVNASIYNFQPHVVSGEAKPPAKRLIVPQPSLRFNDIDNVGITGRHYVLHNHIGQHAFRESKKYDQDKYFKDMFEWATQGLGIPEEKLVLHEDSWGGGGNLGACMEFFVDGLELWNQVYMFYSIEGDDYEELDLKVLDMGMGHERITWISQGSSTSYECVMPDVVNRLYDITGLKPDSYIWQKFLPYSGYLNIDEVDDIEETWKMIADKIDVDVKRLKDEIKPVSALYSVAEHARALLFALSDGKLPSNSKGGHNLRVIARRAMDFIDDYGWDVKLKDVVEWHAKELNEMFPKLQENIEDVKRIIEVEREKFNKSKEKAEKYLERLDADEITLEKMIELYDSEGISPKTISKKFNIEVPQNFYKKITERQEEKEKDVKEDDRFDTKHLEPTEDLYHKKQVFKAKVLDVQDDYVILNRTAFYPTSGGQMHDTGTLNDKKVVEVLKADGVIFHKVPNHNFDVGDKVKGSIDAERRNQITKHHSATHVINNAAREVLGSHIWQAGAYKDTEKARLDVTHYELPTEEEVRKIEKLANKMVDRKLKVRKRTMDKRKVEEKYGFRVYQGGIVPGNRIRVVEIEDTDIEACGGTHVDNTKEIGEILIKKVSKVQDGIVRFEITAGDRTREFLEEMQNIAETCTDLLDCNIDQLPAKSEELFQEWKKLKKEVNKVQKEMASNFIDKIEPKKINDKKIIIDSIQGAEMSDLKKVGQKLSSKDVFMLLFGVNENITYVFGSSGENIDIGMGQFSKSIFDSMNGKGGGDKKTCQGIVKDTENLDNEINKIIERVKKKLGN